MIVKRVFVLLFLLGLIRPVWGQEQMIPDRLSLEKAKAIALENSLDFKTRDLNREIALKEIEKARWQRIPDIYANFDLRRNLITQTTPVPAIAFDPTAGPGDIRPMKFMTDWNTSTGLNAKIDLFNPNAHGKIKEARQEAKISQTEQQITATEIESKIETDYVACLIAKEQLELAISDTLYKSHILSNIQKRFLSGKATETDLNTAKIIKNDALAAYYEAIDIERWALLQLLYDMGLELDNFTEFSFTSTLKDLLIDYQAKEFVPKEGLSLKKWKQKNELTGIQLKNNQLGFMPTIALNGFYGFNFYSNQFDFFKGTHWYGNSYIGLSVQIPVTQGLYRVQQSKILNLQLRQDIVNYQKEEELQDLNRKRLLHRIHLKEKALLLKKENIDLQQSSLNRASELLDRGRMTLNDWLNQNQLALQAQTAYLQAAYEYVQTKMELMVLEVQ